MSNPVLVVDPATLHPGSGKGPATGDIWIALGGCGFPRRGWNDLVVVILAAWGGAMARLIGGSSSRERIHFMEGPYFVDVAWASEGHLRLKGTGPGEQSNASIDVEVSRFVECLLSCSDAILEACRTGLCWSSDADELEKQLATLRQLTEQSRGQAGHLDAEQ